MTHYLLEREQWIPRPIEDVFEFFADASNLEAITPPWLGFKILSARPISMQSGARIAYQLRLHGVPVRWLTDIETWDPPMGFVDVQTKGPYRLWHHTHSFESSGNGTVMRDSVRYALPFGPLGRLVHALWVKSEIEAIFNFRAQKIADLMGASHLHK